jgi:outer membrane protein assembly factor BamA
MTSTRILSRVAGIAFCFLVVHSLLLSQTREEELEQQRRKHAERLSPETTSRTEEWFRRVKDENLLARINYGYNGLGVKAGGLVNGGGFAIGPQYLRDDFMNGKIGVSGAAQITTRNYQKAEAALHLPKLLKGRMAFDLRGAYRNYPSLQYYGPGPDSPKTRTNYRMEDTALDGTVTLLPVRYVRFGAAAGLLNTNVGPGTDNRFVSAEQVFRPSQSPGIDQQSDFYRYGGFGQFDYRDDPFGPRAGGNYVVQYNRYEDRRLDRHSFNVLDVDLQQYVSLFNKSRVLAFRAHSRLTDRAAGQTIPFYLQPVLGGSDDLRGFRAFRFTGNNSFVMNGEYRWAIFSGLDGAIFVDAGKVFDRRGQLNFRDLEASSGFGLRFNARNQTFIRVDIGFSHEGFQVWFKFGDVFGQRRPGTADSQPIL